MRSGDMAIISSCCRAANRREADPGAFELLRQMQPLKHAEQLVLVLHVETRAVVLDEYLHVVAPSVNAADLDFGRPSRARELDRVGDQIVKGHSKHRAVAIACRQPGD